MFPVPVVAVFALVLGIFVFKHNTAASVNRGFLACGIAVFIWLFVTSLGYIIKDRSMALVLGKLGYIGVLYIPAVFYHFTIGFLKKTEKAKFIAVIYGISSIFTFYLFLTSCLVSGVNVFPWGYYIRAGILTPVFLLFFVSSYLSCLILLLLAVKEEKGGAIDQIKKKYIFIAFFIPVFACIDFIPQFNILVYPLGYIFIFIWLSVVAYTILKYQFLDIRLVFTRTAILIIVYALIISTPFVFIGCFRSWLVTVLKDKWFYPPLFLYSVLALLAPYIYLRLQEKAEHKRMMRQLWLHQSLAAASKTTIEVQSVNKLAKVIPRYLLRLYAKLDNKIEHISLFLLDKSKKMYQLRSSVGKKKLDADTVICADSYLVEWFTRTRNTLIEAGVVRLKEVAVLVYEDIDYLLGKTHRGNIPGEDLRHILERLKGILWALDARIVIPSVYQNELLGFLILGEKTPDLYTSSDIDTFSVLANDSAMSFKAAELFEDLKIAQARMIQSEKLSLLGQLASSMAHEINNPLAIISGHTQLLIMEEKDKRKRETLEKIDAQTARGYKIIRRLLNFSRLPKEEIKDININDLIDETLELVDHKMMHTKIIINKKFGSLNIIQGNPTQIQEVLLNLFVNAIQAMPQGGSLSIFTEQVDCMVIIEVQDAGEGVKEEDLENVFDPFYTKGKENGTGLGLFVADQIMKLHKGSIGLKSTIGKGTTFTLKFPLNLDG